MDNDIAAEIQKDAINKARREGSVLDAINDALDAFNGAAENAEIFKRVPEILAEDYGVSEFNNEDVIKATHDVSGIKRNSIKSVVDYVLNEMKHGEHGEENRIGHDDLGPVRVWKKGAVIEETINAATERGIILQLSRIKANPSSAKARNKAALLKMLVKLVVTYAKDQDVGVRKALSKIGRDTIVNYAIDNNVSVAVACDSLLNS